MSVLCWMYIFHFEKMELEGFTYAALVKVGFCHVKYVLKSCIGRNGAIRKRQNVKCIKSKNQKQQIDKNVP